MPQPRKAKEKPPEPDNTIRVKVEGKFYEIDPSDLTWGEAEEAELYFDQAIGDIDWETARGTMFLAYLARHRQDAAFSIADMKRLRVSDFEVAEGRPTDSGDADTGTRS